MARIKEFAIWLKERWLAVLLALSIVISGCFGYLNYRLSQDKLHLGETKKSLEKSISSLQEDLAEMKAERDSFEQNYSDEKQKLDDLGVQLGSTKETVGVLEKLYQTDSELLKKYSKVYFLNENYVPAKLVKVDEKYVYSSKQDQLILDKIWPFLQKLLDDATNAGVDILIVSAYRSFGEQAGLKSSYLVTYGTGANKFSADQGYSEHQLGTAVDFTNSKIGANLSSFGKTQTYQWLEENTYKYGFILSYPENNSYFKFEPWHWRFVGRELAGKLHEENKYFYDLDQRLLDTYLISLF